MDDSEIISHILKGDRRAIAGFYKTYEPALSRFITRKIGNPKDAEEILQDTLLAFLEALRDFHGKASLKTFLFAIGSHKIIDYYRRKKIKHVVFSALPQLETLISPLLAPEEELDTTLLKEKISKVLGRLLPRHRQVLILKYLENLSVEDIASKLSITFKSAESQLFRARKAFVEIFLSL